MNKRKDSNLLLTVSLYTTDPFWNIPAYAVNAVRLKNAQQAGQETNTSFSKGSRGIYSTPDLGRSLPYASAERKNPQTATAVLVYSSRK